MAITSINQNSANSYPKTQRLADKKKAQKVDSKAQPTENRKAIDRENKPGVKKTVY